MIEYLVALVLLVVSLLIFRFFKSNNQENHQKKNTTPPKNNTEQGVQKNTQTAEEIPKEKFAEPKSLLINSFREGKDLQHPFITKDGKSILFHDEKRIFLCHLINFSEKNQKIYTKSVEHDVICDASYSEEKKIIAVGLKNSKSLLFYDLKEEGGKLKLNKIEKTIQTTRKYEINNVTISRDGNYVATSGNDQDTLLQFYEVRSGKEVGNIDTNELKNVEMRMTPDDRCLTVSTLMRNIAVIEYKKSEKFNKELGNYEVSMKLQRNKSISGIKLTIDSYDFSNDDRFFIVSCDNKKLKIFQNFGNVEESKVFTEFSCFTVPQGDKVSLYVESFNIGKLTGYVSVSSGQDIYIFTCEGNLLNVIKNAHDSKINLLKLCYDSERLAPVLISASRDARFHIWRIN